MARIVALKHSARGKEAERTQFLIYLDRALLDKADLKAGDVLEMESTVKGAFYARKVEQDD